MLLNLNLTVTNGLHTAVRHNDFIMHVIAVPRFLLSCCKLGSVVVLLLIATSFQFLEF